MMKYVIESFYTDAKVTVETNDNEVAALTMIARDEDGVHTQCSDGETGEILAIACSPSGENYITPEFASMTLEVLMAHQWGEKKVVEVPSLGAVDNFIAEIMSLPC